VTRPDEPGDQEAADVPAATDDEDAHESPR
jgi:hypothetical protein